MKKVIFISALAIAAAVSCTKSDIVDTKFNEAIGFEAYVGRDAQTKAELLTINEFTTAGIYGFYTGAKEWDFDGTKDASDNYVDAFTANIWDNGTLSKDGTVEPKRFWTNATDKYSFLAYAPKDDSHITLPATGTTSITFAVDENIPSQKDLIYANAINKVKPSGDATTIPMEFKHALSRLTVKASVTTATPFEYHIKEVSINGGFITSDKLNLATGLWEKNGVAVAGTTGEGGKVTYPTTYTFYTNSTVDQANALPTAPAKNFAVRDNKADNYLMMIPVNFTEKKATLTVKYSTYYRAEKGSLESDVYTKTFEVATDFKAGKAYSIDLVFVQATDNEIKFTVSEDAWDEEETTTHNPAN